MPLKYYKNVKTTRKIKGDDALIDKILLILAMQRFIRNFRLDQRSVKHLVDALTPLMSNSERVNAVDPTVKVLIALNFFGTGSYQFPVGNNINMAVSQSTVSRAINEVTEALNHPSIFNHWVQFPSSFRKLDVVRREFFRKHKFPGVVGCIDCTHVAIFPPSTKTHDERSYVNRKNYHSINVQLICDSDLKILNVIARYPGCTNDNFIWNSSSVLGLMKQIYEKKGVGTMLLGDSGYSVRPWLMTPIPDAVPNSPEDRYNTVFKKARCTIERCNGVLKMRFRCLLKHRVLHYSPEKCSKIINACVVLHNICIENKIPEYSVEAEDSDMGIISSTNAADSGSSRNPLLDAGRNIQRQIVQKYFM